MERFNRLAHSIWDCKYHVVWIPKYRRKEFDHHAVSQEKKQCGVGRTERRFHQFQLFFQSL